MKLIRYIWSIIRFTLKFFTLFILHIFTIGLVADKEISFATAVIFSPIFGITFCFLFWKWVIQYFIKKNKEKKVLPKKVDIQNQSDKEAHKSSQLRVLPLPTKNINPPKSNEANKQILIDKEISFYKKASEHAKNNVKPKKTISFASSPRKSVAKEKAVAKNNPLSIIWNDGPHHIKFSYIDRDGYKTKRSVSMSQIGVNDHGEMYIIGRCYDKNATRTFRIDRINSTLVYQGIHYDINEFINDICNI